MRHKIYILLIVSIFSTVGCMKYLDLVPENDIETVETIFETRNGADVWLKTCQSFVSPLYDIASSPVLFGSDEYAMGDYVRQSLTRFDGSTSRYLPWTLPAAEVTWGFQRSQAPYGNIWSNSDVYAAIRYCNVFIKNINGVYNMPEDEKREWKAQVQALRAFYYFELLRRYGPIVIVPDNIEVSAPISEMQQPRVPVDSAVNYIVSTIDEVKDELPVFDEREIPDYVYYCREAAYALKAQVLFYAASPIFNGNANYKKFKNKAGENFISSEYDKEKWQRAIIAIEEAIDVSKRGNRGLNDDFSEKKTALLNTMKNIEMANGGATDNPELLYIVRDNSYVHSHKHDFILPALGSDNDSQYDPEIHGCVGASIKQVERYYTNKGLPIDQDKEWGYSYRYTMGKESALIYQDVVPLNTDVLRLHLRREPRFYAHIAADRTYWQRGKGSKNNLFVEARFKESFGTRYGVISPTQKQNISGYWVKKNLDSDVSSRMYNQPNNIYCITRLAELYLMLAEARNEYLDVPDATVYEPLNVVRKRAGIPDVEVSWAMAINPERITSKAGMREIIRQEWDIEFAFEGMRFWNVRRWLIAHKEFNESVYGWNILGSDAKQFYNNFKGPIVVSRSNKFSSPRDYLFPIQAEEILVSGFQQNPGW